MRPIARIWWLVPLVLGAALYLHFAPQLLGRPAAGSPAQRSALLQPTATPLPFPTPFVYPLTARYSINSLFDHDDPNLSPDGDMIGYTGAAVHDDPGGADDCCWQEPGTGIWVCSYVDDGETWSDLRWDQDNEGGCTELGGPGWLFYDGHNAYDLACGDNVPVLAAGEGVAYVEGAHTVYIDHGWNRYRTYYRHLSAIDIADGESVSPGEQVGESGSAHLHFEANRYDYGAASWRRIDPFGWEGGYPDPWPYNVGNLWLGSDPIPMGYRDQAGAIHGPFELDDPTIRDWWLSGDVARRLGSPVGLAGDWQVPACPGQALELNAERQDFERGYIWYCDSAPEMGGAVTYRLTYLPAIQASENTSEWNSTIHIRNLHPNASAQVNVTFSAPDGWVLDSRTYRDLAANATWEVKAHDVLWEFLDRDDYAAVFAGTAVVAASQDVAVMVRTERAGEVTAYTGLMEPPIDPGHRTGWGEASTSIYVPTVFWSPDDWPGQEWQATIHVQNVGNAPASVDVTFYDRNGDSVTGCEIGGWSIPVNGGQDFVCRTNDYYGAAVVQSTNGQPLAVVVTQEDLYYLSAKRASQYNAFSSGATNLYVPNVMRDWYGWTSSLTVQNIGGTVTAFRIHYRGEQGDDRDCRLTNLLPNRSCIIVQDQGAPTSGACVLDTSYEDGDCSVPLTPGGWEGSVWLESESQDIVAIVNQEHRPIGADDRRHQSYSAFVLPGNPPAWNLLYAPLAVYEYHPDPINPVRPCVFPPAYRSAGHVQLVGGGGAWIYTADGYYGDNGSPLPPGAGSSRWRETGEVAMFYVPTEYAIGCGFRGSVKVAYTSCSAPPCVLSGIHNFALTHQADGGETGDFGASYNMPQRFDGTAASSEVGDLPTYSGDAFEVTWSGTDDLSGVADYDVQACQGECAGPAAPWTDWLTHTTVTASLFYGDDGVAYSFRCRARDQVGNEEDYPDSPDAQTTVDITPPSSSVDPLPSYSQAVFRLSWFGSDATSGVQDYDLQACQGDCAGPQAQWSNWLLQTTDTSAYFEGDHGLAYSFRCRARDHAGNQEAYPQSPDAATIVDAHPPSTTVEPLPLYTTSPSFLVRWHGSDDLSGLDYYDLYYRDESAGSWTLWLGHTSATQSTFSGAYGHTYHFCSRGVDRAGNAEACPPPGIGEWPIRSDAHTGVTPASRVADLPPYTAQTRFLVGWSGSPGVQGYDVQVRDGQYGAWQTWLSNVPFTSAWYTGQWGHIYYFRSRARQGSIWELYPYDYDTYTKLVEPARGEEGPPAAPLTLPPDEAPDRQEEVTRTQPLGLPVVGFIAPEGDVDWYRFELTQTMRLRVALGDLPADYDLYVFDGTGRFLWASTWGQRLPEEVVVRVPAGVYYIRLAGYAGAWDGEVPYRLLVEAP